MATKIMMTLFMITSLRLIQWCGSCLILYLRNSLFSPRELSTDIEHCGCGYSGGWLLFSRFIDGWSYPRFIDRVLWNWRWDPVCIVSSHYGIRVRFATVCVSVERRMFQIWFVEEHQSQDKILSAYELSDLQIDPSIAWSYHRSIDQLSSSPTNLLPYELFHPLVISFGRNMPIRHFR